MNKVLNLLLTIALFSTCAMAINAEECVVMQGPNGDQYGEYEGNPQYYTEEEHIKRNELIENISRHPSPLWGSQKVLEITGYEQENNYYCGVAVTQMILKYKLGTTYSQSSLASDLGTTSTGGTSRSRILSLLNSKLGSGTYIDVTTSDISIANGIQYSVDGDCPLVLPTKTSYLIGYNGYSDGKHYVLGIGYRLGWVSNFSYNDIMYFDPFRTKNGSFGSHYITFDQMQNAVNANNTHYLMKAN